MEKELKSLRLLQIGSTKMGNNGSSNNTAPAANTGNQKTGECSNNTAPAAKTGSLKHILKEFNNVKAKTNEADQKRNMEGLRTVVLEQFIPAMKEVDPLFNELYKDNYYTGSYYEGLKVSDTYDFDLNIRIELPFKWDDVQIVTSNVPTGFTQYKILKPLETLLALHPKWNIYKNLTKLMDKDFLSQKKINEWCQGVGDKALVQNKTRFSKITSSRHGPAYTLKVNIAGNNSIDVDLVPVIKLEKPPKSVRKTPFLKSDSITFIVPKPTGLDKGVPNLFRLSMPVVERQVLESKGCVKMLIRTFKIIRNTEKWTFFASYFIKTLFMWNIEKHPEASYWAEDRLDQLFIEMLKQFIEVLNKKELMHFLFTQFNLISAINPQTLHQMKVRLETYLEKSQNDLPGFKSLLKY